MKKIFLPEEILKKGTFVKIEGDLHHHLANVLRIKVGESFIVSDNENNEFVSVVEKISSRDTIILLKDFYYREDFQYPETTLFFSVLKGDKNEEIIQKCTELGIDNFVPVITKNTIIKIDNENGDKKLKKWQLIAKESSMQSGRFKIPKVLPIINFNDIESYTPNSFKIVGLLEKKSKSFINLLNEIKKFDRVSFFIGPEGDFTKDEIDTLKNNNWQGIRFTNNVLRSETACFYVASSIFFYYGRGI